MCITFTQLTVSSMLTMYSSLHWSCVEAGLAHVRLCDGSTAVKLFPALRAVSVILSMLGGRTSAVKDAKACW